jgi:hypothetical protein
MKTTALALALGLGLWLALIALGLVAEALADIPAPFGAIPALVFFGALITALIKSTN